MSNPHALEWMNRRLAERAEERRQQRSQDRDPNLLHVDASKFSMQLGNLTRTMIYSVEREGPRSVSDGNIAADTAVILRQLFHTYSLIIFVNADETREQNTGYMQPYSFVILPLVRTMIDGFYNCTAMLDDPSRSRIFRISGLYRIRESIGADEARYGQDPGWRRYLDFQRESYGSAMRAEGFTEADLDDKSNEWPLLGTYLKRKPDTPHKQVLRKLTLGFWKEYSSISHASYDGLVSIFPFIAGDKLGPERVKELRDAGERKLTMHVCRTAALLLCLLTEIQHYYKFSGPAQIDERLTEIGMQCFPSTK